jgi:hypothetical protein
MTKPETSSLMRFWSLMMGCGAVRQAALMQGSSQSRDGTLDGMQEEAAFASDAPGDVQRVPPNAPRMKAGADADAETAQHVVAPLWLEGQGSSGCSCASHKGS